MSDTLAAIARLPVSSNGWEEGDPGVYAFYRGNGAYYIGMTGDLACRFHEHRRAGMSLVAQRVTVWPTSTTEAARRLERNLIILLRPSENDRKIVVSDNERHWYHAIWTWTLGPEGADNPQIWGWCKGCGELVVFINGAYLPATFGSADCDCAAIPHWDPTGLSWDTVARHVVALFGGPTTEHEQEQRRVTEAFRNEPLATATPRGWTPRF